MQIAKCVDICLFLFVYLPCSGGLSAVGFIVLAAVCLGVLPNNQYKNIFMQ